MLRRLHADERGIALITAALVSVVVLTLTTVVVAMAIHNSESSSYDRRRVQAVGAAEAGIDYYMSLLSNTGGASPPCTLSRNLAGSPGSFTVTATFYATEGSSTPLACPLGAGVVPQAARLVSAGRSVTATPVRTMEAYLRLSVSQGGTFGVTGAIFAENGINFTSNARIGGQNYSDADIYTNGSISLASSSIIYGNMYAQGGVTIKSNASIKQGVWAGGNISMSAGATILGDATTPASMSLSGNSTIGGNARAGGTITGGTVVGIRSPNSSGVTPPPARAYPTFTFVPTDWTNNGYAIQTFTGASACSSAVSYIQSGWTGGDVVVRIAAPGSSCTTTFNTGSYGVRGNLAIVSDGPVLLRTNARFAPSPAGSTYTVYLFTGLNGSAPCNLTAESNSGFYTGLSTMLYVPSTCTLDLSSNSVITSGQIIGGTVNFKHTSAFVANAVMIPGSGVGGFKEDIVYKREIVG